MRNILLIKIIVNTLLTNHRIICNVAYIIIIIISEDGQECCIYIYTYIVIAITLQFDYLIICSAYKKNISITWLEQYVWIYNSE